MKLVLEEYAFQYSNSNDFRPALEGGTDARVRGFVVRLPIPILFFFLSPSIVPAHGFQGEQVD